MFYQTYTACKAPEYQDQRSRSPLHAADETILSLHEGDRAPKPVFIPDDMTLTFELYIQTGPSEEPIMSSL